MDKYHSNYLLIIGNGFDLSLGLKTSYESFFKSDHFNILDKSSGLIKHLSNALAIKNWIDLETEIKLYSARINETKRQIKRPGLIDNSAEEKKVFRELTGALNNYLCSIGYDIKEDAPAYKLATSILTKAGSKTILDFNYTKSVELITQGSKSSFLNHVKVHGSIEANNIIVGVEDEAEKVDEFYKKAHPPFYPGVNVSKYLDNAFQEIIIFGYSLGETDHSYFKEFFKNLSYKTSSKDVLMTLYYYDMDAADELNDQLYRLTDNRLKYFKSLNRVEMKCVSELVKSD